jgi:transcriptional regulator with XRE-family HTH domain
VTATAGHRPRLRALRKVRSWTHQQVADRLVRLAWMHRRENVGVNADMVAKWERGTKGVSARYRDLFCLLFGVTVEQLGFGDAPPGQNSQTAAADQSLLSMLDSAVSLLDQLGAAGTVLAPQMLAVWKDQITSRRGMFAMLGPGADPAATTPTATTPVADFEQLADHYQALYRTAAPAALLTPVAAHLGMTDEALRHNPSSAERRRLLVNRARVAILAGRLALDDLGNAMAGRADYSLAIDAAREAGDDLLTAVAHGYAAQLSAAEGHTAAALDQLSSANRTDGRIAARRQYDRITRERPRLVGYYTPALVHLLRHTSDCTNTR